MSVVDRKGHKVLVPRRLEGFWDAVRDVYPDDDPAAWRQLAMLTLQEVAGWPVERIARTLGHRRAQVVRSIEEAKRDLRARFEPMPRNDEHAP